MNLLDAILLGFIQGVTEFLPISSSGHLVIGNHLLGIESDNILFEVFVHLGTLVAIIYYYKDDIIKTYRGIILKESKHLNYLLLIIIATIPAIVIGLIFNNEIKVLYNIRWVSLCLLITGTILFLSKFAKQKLLHINYSQAFIIGLFQAIAILPGISRSGVTIAVALLLGIHNKEASKFSFFMAIPVIIGAVILEMTKINQIESINFNSLIVGFSIAGIIGYFSISWLIKLINKLHFWKFSLYTWSIGLIILFIDYYA